MKKYIPNLVIILLAVFVLLAVERCSFYRKTGAVATVALIDTVAYFNNTIGTQTATIKTLTLNAGQMHKLVLEKDRQLKDITTGFSKVQSVIKYKSDIKVDTIYVAYAKPADTLPIFKRQGAVFEKWYSFDYTVDNSGLALANLSMQTETAIATGFKRKWFLGKETLVTDVSNTNPYVTVTDLKAAEVTLPSPWYKKWYVWLAAGAVGGFVLAK